ncbi:MAG: hypothetical protein ACYTEQ_20375 [Planctomycetota bacterium]|jgi:hypothetical protein
MKGKVVHEEAVDWDPAGEPIQFDVCGSSPALDAPHNHGHKH